MKTLLTNIRSLVTPVTGGGAYKVQAINNAVIAIAEGIITYAGSVNNSPQFTPDEIHDCEGKLATPGLIDPHTHPVFAATRENEFHLRNTGVSYAEIAEKGGGIRSSVRELRKASLEELINRLEESFDRFISLGTTTIEAKSGYGLALEHELKSLEALKAMGSHPLEVVPTFLGAHEVPDEYRNDREAYIRLVTETMIPAVMEKELAEYCDIFVEKNVFTITEARRILTAAKSAGLKIRLHVDQLTSGGGAELAAEVGAVSAEHLDYISEEGIDRMAEAGVIFNLLPGAVFFLGHSKYPPARKIIDRGGVIALATDFNPGSSMSRSLPLMMTLGCVYMGLNADEALCAVTINAAKSICREDRIGSLEAGKQADIVLWDAPGHDYIPYNYGENLVAQIYKRGRLIKQTL